MTKVVALCGCLQYNCLNRRKPASLVNVQTVSIDRLTLINPKAIRGHFDPEKLKKVICG